MRCVFQAMTIFASKVRAPEIVPSSSTVRPCFAVMSLKTEAAPDPLAAQVAAAPLASFVDPVADLAILGAPDSQALAAKNERYDKLVEARPALRIANLPLVSERCRIGSTEFRMPPLWTGPAYLLSRDGRIFGCTVLALHQGLVIEASDEPVEGGMSGSPIVSEHGAAVGIVSSSADDGREGEGAFLYWSVPGWMLAALAGK